MEVIREYTKKQRRVDGTIAEYTYKVKTTRKETFNTTKSLSTEVKQKIRDDVETGFKRKIICEKYNVSYYVLREILAEAVEV